MCEGFDEGSPDKDGILLTGCEESVAMCHFSLQTHLQTLKTIGPHQDLEEERKKETRGVWLLVQECVMNNLQ